MGAKSSKPKQPHNANVFKRNDWLKSELRKLQRDHDQVNRNLQNISNQIRFRKHRIGVLEMDIRNLKKSIKNYTKRYNDAKEMIRQYNLEIEELKLEEKKLEGEIQVLRNKIAALKKIIRRIDNDNVILESEFVKLAGEYNTTKGVSIDNDERYFDLLTIQNGHLTREYDYLENDLIKGDQNSSFVQPKIDNWELANHFLRVAYYAFALVLLLFLYQHFSMDKIYSTVLIISLIILYPLYIVPLERFVYENVMYMGKFITAQPVK